MARAYGWNSTLFLAYESNSAYGTASTTKTHYKPVRFFTSNLDSEQGLIATEVLGQGKEATDPFLDVVRVDGDIEIPLDLNNFGYWLKAAMGDPTTSGTDKKVHIFSSSTSTIPSLTVEVGIKDAGKYFVTTGARVNTFTLNFERSGEAKSTVNLIGQSVASSDAPKNDSPSPLDFKVFSQFQGSLKKGTDLLANVTSGNLTYSNNLERVETIRSDGKVDGVDLGMTTIMGSVTLRYADEVLMAAATGQSPLKFTFTYKIDADNLFEFIVYRVFLPKPKRVIDGPGGISVTYDFHAAKDKTAAKMAQATLKNAVASY